MIVSLHFKTQTLTPAMEHVAISSELTVWAYVPCMGMFVDCRALFHLEITLGRIYYPGVGLTPLHESPETSCVRCQRCLQATRSGFGRTSESGVGSREDHLWRVVFLCHFRCVLQCPFPLAMRNKGYIYSLVGSWFASPNPR